MNFDNYHTNSIYKFAKAQSQAKYSSTRAGNITMTASEPVDCPQNGFWENELDVYSTKAAAGVVKFHFKFEEYSFAEKEFRYVVIGEKIE